MEVVGRRFAPAAGRPLESFGVGRAVFGRFRTAAEVPEELVVGLVAENEVEIHCHGGPTAVEAICEALVAEGCEWIDAAAWAREQESDPLAAEALFALADARTERTAAILLDQYRGALSAELRRIEALIEQDVMLKHNLQLKSNPPEAATAIQRLLDRAEIGLHLTQPLKVVLAGAPNAGKSSLANAILGYERAIVFHQPGTTRDVLTAGTAIDGWPVELADTAGLRVAADALEAEGVARAERQVADADLVIFVADTTAAWGGPLYDDVCRRAKRPPIVAHNKCDLAPPPADGRPRGIEISAKTGSGIEALLAAISPALAPDPPRRGEAVPFTIKHVAALQEAADSVVRGDPGAAMQRLRTLNK